MAKKRKKISKEKAQEAHAMRRMYERYGLPKKKDVYNQLVKQILEPRNAIKLEEQSNRVHTYAVKYSDNIGWIPCAYDRARKKIVSFLPKEYLENYSNLI